MPDLILDPVLPFVWPDSRVLCGSHAYANAVPFESLITRAKSLAGVVSGVDLEGVRWFSRVAGSGTLRCRIVFVLYPASPTRKDVLRTLLETQSAFAVSAGPESPLIELRVLPFDLSASASLPNGLCCIDSETLEACLITGSSPNFGLGSVEWAHLNLAFRPDPALLESWLNWFEWVWEAAVPLTTETAEIPALVPAPGTVEAAQAWQAYLTCCGHARAREGVIAPGADGTAKPTVAEELGMPRLDPLAGKIDRIFRLGALASVDKTSRTPPLDVPVKAELFGIPSWRRAGGGTRRVEYRFSVLDDRDLRGLEAKRRAAGELLSRFSFPLGDGIRWMPHRARPLLEAELGRLNEAGNEALTRVLGDDVSAFVKKRKDRVAKPAQAFYEEHYPGQSVPDSTIDAILEDCEKRLKKARQGQLLPKITYTPVQFVVGQASEWASPWGQAASLLQAIAEFPRKALTDRFFLRDLDVDEDELLEIMDVCEDAIRKVSKRDAKTRAKEDLEVLARLARAQTDARSRCELLLRLIGGEEISAEVPDEETT